MTHQLKSGLMTPYWIRDLLVKLLRPLARIWAKRLGPDTLALPTWFTKLLAWSFHDRWTF